MNGGDTHFSLVAVIIDSILRHRMAYFVTHQEDFVFVFQDSKTQSSLGHLQILLPVHNGYCVLEITIYNNCNTHSLATYTMLNLCLNNTCTVYYTCTCTCKHNNYINHR